MPELDGEPVAFLKEAQQLQSLDPRDILFWGNNQWYVFVLQAQTPQRNPLLSFYQSIPSFLGISKSIIITLTFSQINLELPKLKHVF